MLDRSTQPPTLSIDPPADGWSWTAYCHILQLATAPYYDTEGKALYNQLAHAILDEDLNPRAGRP